MLIFFLNLYCIFNGNTNLMKNLTSRQQEKILTVVLKGFIKGFADAPP